MPERKVRFSVRDITGKRSSVWKLWVTKSDIYIQPRFMENACKVSLHESGICHWKMTPEYMHSNPSHNHGDPYHAKWKLVESLNFTASHIFRVVFPGSELRHAEEENPKKTIKWLPAPSHNESLFVDCYITRSDTNFKLEDLTNDCLFSFELPNGRLLFGLATKFPTTDFDLSQLALMKMIIAQKKGEFSSSTRAVAVATIEEYVVSMIEVATD